MTTRRFITKFIGKRPLHAIRQKLEQPKNKWSIEKRTKELMQLFLRRRGYMFDIYNPQLFGEKIQWYKLFYDHPDLCRAVDKYTFKEYIREKLGDGYTIPLYGVWTDVSDLRKDWDSLPNAFVLKSTVSGFGNGVILVKDKSKIKFKDIKKTLKAWMNPHNTLINSYCRGYYNATPRIIAEKYESNSDGELSDYKLHCFNGKPYCFFVVSNKEKSGDGVELLGESRDLTYYNTKWEKLDAKSGYYPNSTVEKPKYLTEMIRIAAKLSSEFPYVRVDFFETDEKLYLSELTFYPGGGFTVYQPASFDKELGDLFVLPESEK